MLQHTQQPQPAPVQGPERPVPDPAGRPPRQSHQQYSGPLADRPTH